MNLPNNMELIGTSTLLINPVERSDNLEWLHSFDEKCRLATGKGYKQIAEEIRWEHEVENGERCTY